MIRFLLCLLTLTASCAFAQVTTLPSPPCATPTFKIPAGSNITLTWLAPTTGTQNGVSVPLTGTVTYNLYSLNGANPVNIAPGLTVTSSTRTSLVPGTDCYAVTAVVAGVESALSTTAAVTVLPVPPATPNPPAGLTCTLVIPTGGSPITGNCTTQ